MKAAESQKMHTDKLIRNAGGGGHSKPKGNAGHCCNEKMK